MLNWDDPLNTVQNKEKTNFKAQGEASLKTSICRCQQKQYAVRKFYRTQVQRRY